MATELVHLVALGFLALTVIRLMVPAALHRIVRAGEGAPAHVLGTRFLPAASVALALGISTDLGVALAQVIGSDRVGLVPGSAALGLLTGLWHAYPLVLRRRRAAGTARSRSA